MDPPPNPYREFRRFRLRADRAVASTSPDHQVPWGTRKDNSRNRRFNEKLYKLFAAVRGPLWIMDLGCSGGGFVRECLDDGCLAVGVEGSDFSRRFRRAEWRFIPEFLFTADITTPFEISGEFADGDRPARFHVITAWEVLEHIAETDLPAVADNVRRHLASDGLWIVSISPNPDVVHGVALHQTVRPRSWWIEKLTGLGWVPRPEYVRFFNTQFVRGPKQAAPGSFHLVLTTARSDGPPIPPENWMIRLYDRWLGSLPQRLLKELIVGR